MSVVAQHQLLATYALLVSPLSFQLSHASVLLDGRSTSGLDFVDNYETGGLSPLEPRPGYNAFVGIQPQILSISRRDCLSNGSNFCFGNSVNFCADCGTCCVDGQYCCGKGGICCGTGCCESGLTCSKEGKCLSPEAAVTVTSTIYETSTYLNTKETTIVIVEVGTSTVLSTVETTISNAATQTDVEWVTATVTAAADPAVKRVDDGHQPPPPKEKRSFLESLFHRGHEWVNNGPAVHRKQAISEIAPAATGASTLTEFATQISTLTNIDVRTITKTSTSYVMTTILETVTKVLNAKTTVLVTSTLTVTSHQPTTKFIITTADPVQPATASNTPTSSSSTSPTPVPSPVLSTPAIAGIAVGSAAAAILIIAIVIFLIRRRRLKEPSFDMAHPPPPDHMHSRQPTLPNILPHFIPSAPPHHAATANLPKGFVAGGATPPFGTPGHQRRSSGFSTLVGTPALGAGVKGDRRSEFSLRSGGTLEAPAAEVPGSQVPEWYEADGKPVPVNPQQQRPWMYRQGGPYYYHIPSPGQRLAGVGAEELDASGNGGASPLTLTVSQETVTSGTASGSPAELGGGQQQQHGQQGGYDGGVQQPHHQGDQQQSYHYPGS